MVTAIIVAAGKGTRMGPNVDKLFLPIGKRPLIGHTWQRIDSAPEIDHIVMVVREGMQSTFSKLASELDLKKQFSLVAGGKERQDSVWNGLEALPPATEIVVIQDAARPCTSRDLISNTVARARKGGAAVAAQRVTDTIKESDDGQIITRNIDRSKLWAVQTPQTFRKEVIQRALEAVRQRGLAITDDTAACELIGQQVELVESSAPNPKATSPADLPFIEMLLSLEAKPC
jgi:2-C-methyl-D-erythritol 4-phosphate cytidylyltransferase